MNFFETRIRLCFASIPPLRNNEQRLIWEASPETVSGEATETSASPEKESITSEMLSETEFKKRVISRIEKAAQQLDLTWKNGADSAGFSLDDLSEPDGVARWEKELEDREGAEEKIALRDAVEGLLKLYTTTMKGAKDLPQTATQLEQQVGQALAKLETETQAKNQKYQREYVMKETIAARAEANQGNAAKVLRADSADQLWRRLGDPLVTEIGRLQGRKVTPGDFTLRIGSLPENQQKVLDEMRFDAEQITADIKNGQFPVELNPLLIEYLKANPEEIEERYLAFVLHHTDLDNPAKEMGYFRTFGSDAYKAERLEQRELRARGERKGRHGILDSHRAARATMKETGEIDNNTSKIWRFSAEKLKEEASFAKFLEAYQVVYFARKLALPKDEHKTRGEDRAVQPKNTPDAKTEAPPSAPDLLSALGLSKEQLAEKSAEDVLELLWKKIFASDNQKFAEFARAGLEEREGKNWIRKFLPSGEITPENLQQGLQKMLLDIAPQASEESRAQQYLEQKGLPQIDPGDALNISKLLAYRFQFQNDGKIYELDGTTIANPENVHRFLKHHQLVNGEYSEQDPKLLWNLIAGKELSAETRARIRADVAKYEQIVQALTPAQQKTATDAGSEGFQWNWQNFWKIIAELFDLHGGIWDRVRDQADEATAEELKAKFSPKKAPANTPDTYVFEGNSDLSAEEKKKLETEPGVQMALAKKLLEANKIDLPEGKKIEVQFKKNELTITFKSEVENTFEAPKDWGQILADRLQPEKAAQNMPEIMKLVNNLAETEFLGMQTTPEDRTAALEKFIELSFETSNYKHIWPYLQGRDLSQNRAVINKMDTIGKFWLKEATGKEFSNAKTTAISLDNEGNLILRFANQEALKFAQKNSQVAFKAELGPRVDPKQEALNPGVQFGDFQDPDIAKQLIEIILAKS